MAARRPQRDEAGSTLVEMLVTLVILGIAFVALLGGMFTAVTTSDRHRKQTVADSALRSFAEAVKAAPYDADCSTYAASYPSPPPNFTPRVVSCCSVPPSSPASTSSSTLLPTTLPSSIPVSVLPCGPPADSAPQLLTLEVTSADGRATETVELVKRDERPPSTTSST